MTLLQRPRSRYANKRSCRSNRLFQGFDSLEERVLLSNFAIRLESDGGTTLNIGDNQAGDSNPDVGVILFNGSIDSFNLAIAAGLSKPAVGDPSLAQLTLSSVTATSSLGGTLTISLTDTDFSIGTGVGTAELTSQIGGTTDGATSLQTFVDTNNAQFGVSGAAVSTPGLQGPFSGAFDDTASVQFPQSGDFSITSVVNIVIGPGSLQSFGADALVVPIATPIMPDIDIEKCVHSVATDPDSAQGLTPGYWKQPHHFEDWTGFTPDQSYDTIFGVSDPDHPTLLEALSRGGGDTNALGRHAVAALLNAANPMVNYSFDQAAIIAMVQAAYADSGIVESTKDTLEAQNQLGLSIGSGSSTPSQPSPCLDADTAEEALEVAIGQAIEYEYQVTNTGDVSLADIIVVDDATTPADTSDDFNPVPVEDGGFNVGDLDMNHLLDPGETWHYAAMDVVLIEGPHVNIGKVTGTPVSESGDVLGPDIMDQDPAHIFVSTSPDAEAQGLTPGFWKQSQHFQYWTGYATTDSYEEVFGVSVSGDPTLLDALKAKGKGLVNALLRHSTAALLNAAHPEVNYAFSVDEVIFMVQQAFVTGNYEQVKDLFEEGNESGGIDLKD